VAKTRRRQNVATFVGRKMEKRAIHSIAAGMIEEPEVAQSTMVFLTGDSGFGKVRFLFCCDRPRSSFTSVCFCFQTALASSIFAELKAQSSSDTCIVVGKSSSTETEQRIPLRCVLFHDGNSILFGALTSTIRIQLVSKAFVLRNAQPDRRCRRSHELSLGKVLEYKRDAWYASIVSINVTARQADCKSQLGRRRQFSSPIVDGLFDLQEQEKGKTKSCISPREFKPNDTWCFECVDAHKSVEPVPFGGKRRF
jgi:hypothetical protein